MNKELTTKYNKIVELLMNNPDKSYEEDFLKDKYNLSDPEYEEIRLVLYVCNYI